MDTFLLQEDRLQLAYANLEWLLAQPDIANIEALGAKTHAAHQTQELESLDLHARSKDLEQILAAPGSHFLGNYVERLWRFYLDHNPRYQVIKQSLQVHGEGQTIGEFDFIVYDEKCGSAIHQELAIKFYLGLPCSTQTLWFGPRNTDRLDIKTSHLRSHQLQLSKDPAAKAALHEIGVKDLTSECIIKGRLFLPFNESLRAAITYTDDKTASLQKGLWFRFQEFESWLVQQPAEQKYHVLQKKQWMSLNIECGFSTGLDAKALLESIRENITQDARSIMVALESESELANDTTHLFIVPDDWANKAYDSISEPPL